MSKQWLRSIKLEVGEAGPLGVGGISIESESLRCAFEIDRDEKPWPNSATIRIWNLNPDHRAELAEQQGIRCRLEAGYQEQRGVLFDGFLREAPSEHDGTNWITECHAGDGELDKDGDPIAGASIHKTWSRGTPCAQILKDFVAEMNIDPGNTAIAGAAAAMTTGAAIPLAFTVDGPVLDELTYFMRSVGLAWSIQDGAMQVRVADVPADTGPLISPQTGLVGRVRKFTRKIERENTLSKKTELATWSMVSGTCLLLPELKPGIGFALTSDAATGAYLCTRVRHAGDTHAREWYTEFEARSYV
jgi:hypothetical protein